MDTITPDSLARAAALYRANKPTGPMCLFLSKAHKPLVPLAKKVADRVFVEGVEV